MSNEVKWIIGVTVVAVVAIGIAAVVSVAVLQFSGLAVDMRSHEDRARAWNNEVVQEIRTLVERMRDDYRERMYGVEDILRELRQIRQGQDEGEESEAICRERALSDIERTVSALMRFRPVRTGDVTQRLDDVLKELQAIRAGLDGDQQIGQEDGQPLEEEGDQQAEEAGPP